MKLLWSNLSLGGLYTDTNADVDANTDDNDNDTQRTEHDCNRAHYQMSQKAQKKHHSACKSTCYNPWGVLTITGNLFFFFQVSSHFSIFFKILNFHDISMTGKVSQFFQVLWEPGVNGFLGDQSSTATLNPFYIIKNFLRLSIFEIMNLLSSSCKFTSNKT